MQMYGSFEGFLLNNALFGLVSYIMTPVLSVVSSYITTSPNGPNVHPAIHSLENPIQQHGGSSPGVTMVYVSSPQLWFSGKWV